MSPTRPDPSTAARGPGDSADDGTDAGAAGAHDRAGIEPEAPAWSFVRELGAGAVAEVSLVELERDFDDLPAGSQLALKRPRADSQDPARDAESLRTEAEISARVEHPCLVDVIGHGEDERGVFLLSRYVEGATLRDLLQRRGSLPEPIVRAIGRDLAGALRALHAAGFVHGDLKPENVRLDADDRAVLLDLGLARRPAAKAAEIAGSLPYLAPERLRGGGPSTSADVFALGVLLHELRTGEHPFAPDLVAETKRALDAGELGDELIARQQTARLEPPSRRAPDTSPLFDAVLAAALDTRPPARPSAEALVRILEDGEAGPWWRQRVERAASQGTRELWFHSGRERLPLVGRGQELDALWAAWERARGGPELRSALIRGDTGSGSSRLPAAFVELVRSRDEGPLALFARCSDTSESRPFGALLELPRRWLQLPESSAPQEREARRVRALLPPREAEVLLAALDPESDAALGGSLSVALARWLACLAQGTGLIVAIDGLERARTSTLTAIARMAEELARSPALLILTLADDRPRARPEELERLLARLAEGNSGRRAAELLELHLGPLDEDHVLELVQRLFHHTAPRLRLASALWQRSRGNPGLLAELLADIAERGDAGADEPGAPWRLLIEPDQLPLPRSLPATIRDRLGRLDSELASWLERFTVLGGDFDRDVVAKTFTGARAPEIDRALAELHRSGWLASRGNRFRLSSPAYRRAVRARIEPDRLRRLHRLTAERLESEGAAIGTVAARLELVRHLRAAGEPRALLDHLVPLLDLVARRGSPQRVLRLARWGLEALDQLPETRANRDLELALLEVGIDAADRFGNRGVERELLDRLMERAGGRDAPPGPAELARLGLLHARYSSALGQVEVATRILAQAVAHAEQASEPTLVSEAHRRLGRSQAALGEFDAARGSLERAAAATIGPRQIALVHFARAQIEVLSDGIDAAGDELEVGLHALRDVDPVPLGLFAGANLLRARWLRSAGQTARALAAARRAVEQTRQSGERRFEAEALTRAGALLAEIGRSDEAELELREARLLARETEDPRAGCLVELALFASQAQIDLTEAGASLERAIELAREIGFFRGEALGLALRARLQRVRRQPAAALADSLRAVELLQRVGAELSDRITIVGTRSSILAGSDTDGAVSDAAERAQALEAQLRRHIARVAAGVRDGTTARTLTERSERLIERAVGSGLVVEA